MAGRQLKPRLPGGRQPGGISPEAAAFLRASPPLRGSLAMWPPLLVRLRRRLRARSARPGLEALQRELLDRVQRSQAAGLDVVEVLPRAVQRTSGEYAIFIHGGGYTGGAALDATAILMADALRLPVLSLEYPLAPEASHPAALDRCLAAYAALVVDRPGRFVLLGESAGGGLALALLHRARAMRLPMPAALGLFTPWCDLAPDGDSFASNDGRDPVIRWGGRLDRSARAYGRRTSAEHPELSPLHGPYDAAFPPCLITTGTRDLFLSLCVRLYWTLRRAGAVAELRVWEGMWHSFNAQPALPEARECRAELAGFLRRHLPGGDAASSPARPTPALPPPAPG